MNSRQIKLFLMEWLVNHGTDPIPLPKLGVHNMDTFYKAQRLGYIEWDSMFNTKVWLTRKGLAFLKGDDDGQGTA